MFSKFIAMNLDDGRAAGGGRTASEGQGARNVPGRSITGLPVEPGSGIGRTVKHTLR